MLENVEHFLVRNGFSRQLPASPGHCGCRAINSIFGYYLQQLSCITLLVILLWLKTMLIMAAEKAKPDLVCNFPWPAVRSCSGSQTFYLY